MKRMGQAAVIALIGVMLGAMAPPAAAVPATDGAAVQAAWASYLLHDTDRPPARAFPFEDCFRRAAAAHDLPLTLLLAVARGESDFDPTAVSHAGAHGLMQILWPGTARHLGLYRLSELHDPCTNAEAGARYLRELLQRYDGDVYLSLAAYNYGPGRIPVDGGSVPSGAQWYSGYIYRHLGYVLGERNRVNSGSSAPPYLAEGKVQIAVFDAPYRAEAFVDSLARAAPTVRLDWFRGERSGFRVMLLFADEADLGRAREHLAAAGFPLNDL